MSIRMVGSAKKLRQSEVRGFEKALRLSVPPAYRKFLLEHNGGHPVPSEVRFKSGRARGEQEVSIKKFLGINVPEPTLNIGYVLEVFVGRIPTYFFPIARDPGGNLFGIATDGELCGKVLFWDHEREAEEGEAPSSKNIDVVSASFEDFLVALERF